MNVIKTAIDGVVIIEPRLFKDDRGYFLNLFQKEISMRKYVPYALYKTMRVNRVMVFYEDYTSKNHLCTKQTSPRCKRSCT